MFKNHIKIALRNIFNQKLFSFINVFGLAAGIACSILILLWVQDEIGYDTFHENSENIYRVVENQFYAGGEIFPVAVTPGPLALALKDEYPEIIHATRYETRDRTLGYQDNVFRERLAYADPSFLEIFSFPLVVGNPATALSDPYSILLSEKSAEKYFGKENPVGKTMLVNNKYRVEVRGVFKNVPENSHLQFDFLLPFVFMKEEGRNIERWSSNSYYTYVQLQKGIEKETVDEKIKDIIKRNNEGSVTEVFLQPMLDIHLYSGSRFAADIGGHGDIEYVNIFSIVALFVLLIACINFMNLSTARSAKRAKEVGLRRVVGAARYQIVRQFFIESILLTFIALVISIVLVSFLLPAFNDLSGKTINLMEIDAGIVAGIILLALFTGVLSGSYPAFYLSSFLPAKVLKENYASGKGGALFRRALVVTQFALSIILIIGTTVVYRQLNFIQNKKLGFQRENILYLEFGEKIFNNIETAKSELLKNHDILSVTASTGLPTYYGNSTSSFGWEGKNPNESILMHFVGVDEDYTKTFNMEMAEGRFYSKEFSADTNSIVVNEAAIKVMGMEDPIGKRLSMWGKEFTIIGVLKDFHFKKLDTKIEPLVFRMFTDWSDLLLVRIAPDNIPNTLNYIKTKLAEIAPKEPFEYFFLDEEFDYLYKSEQRMGKLFSSFSILALLISCLGLFGLASYMAERRTKEIGIRKVLGGSLTNLTYLLTSEFTKLVIFSNIISWPIAYYLMNNWLQNFAYRINIELWFFIGSGLFALLIALLTVFFQTIKAAMVNPVESLKHE